MRSLSEEVPPVLLLDAGNTIVFLDGAVVAEVVAEHGHSITAAGVQRGERIAKREYEKRLQGTASHEDAWAELLAATLHHAGIEKGAARALVPVLRQEHDRFNLWRRVPEGVVQALSAARSAGARLGLVSNSEGQVRRLLERLELSAHFEVIVDSGVEGVRKPDPEIFRRALARMNVEAEQALYAGDIPRVDVTGARAAGLRAVLIDAAGDYPDYDEALRFSSLAEMVDALYAGRR
jgi:putative hydrolase of the HAD superfamily